MTRLSDDEALVKLARNLSATKYGSDCWATMHNSHRTDWLKVAASVDRLLAEAVARALDNERLIHVRLCAAAEAWCDVPNPANAAVLREEVRAIRARTAP